MPDLPNSSTCGQQDDHCCYVQSQPCALLIDHGPGWNTGPPQDRKDRRWACAARLVAANYVAAGDVLQFDAVDLVALANGEPVDGVVVQLVGDADGGWAAVHQLAAYQAVLGQFGYQGAGLPYGHCDNWPPGGVTCSVCGETG